MSVPRWLVAGHVAAAAGVLGADLALLALGWHGLAGAEPGSVYPAMHTISVWLLRPAALLVLTTGLAAAIRGASLREGWVLVKLAVTLALTALVVLVAEPGLSDAVAAGARISDRTRTTYGVVPVATAALLLLNIALGVYRPRRPR